MWGLIIHRIKRTMNIQFSSQHVELSEHDREHCTKKLSVLERFFPPIQDAQVRIRRSTHHQKGDNLEIAVEIKTDDGVFYAEEQGDGIEGVIEMIAEDLRNQSQKHRQKVIGGNRRGAKLRRMMKSIFFWRE